jgi:hypothetical protein
LEKKKKELSTISREIRRCGSFVRNVKIYVNCLVFYFNLGEYREDGHLEIIRRHVFTLRDPWLIQGTGGKIQGWTAHSSRDLFLTESFPVLFSLFCISCQLRVFYFILNGTVYIPTFRLSFQYLVGLQIVPRHAPFLLT